MVGLGPPVRAILDLQCPEGTLGDTGHGLAAVKKRQPHHCECRDTAAGTQTHRCCEAGKKDSSCPCDGCIRH